MSEQHNSSEFVEEHFTASNTVRDIIIGMSDGLTVPFALAAGLTTAIASSSLIVVAGLAEIAAGCISMGLGGYLAAQSDAEHYYSEERKEYKAIRLVPHREQEEVREIFKQYGLNDEQISPIVQVFEKDHEKWVNFMMKNELGLDVPDKKRARHSGLTIAFSYLVGGFVPLSPYIFIHDSHVALEVSIGVTLVVLFIFGYIKSRLIGSNPLKGALRTALLGSIAAAAAFVIAKHFS